MFRTRAGEDFWLCSYCFGKFYLCNLLHFRLKYFLISSKLPVSTKLHTSLKTFDLLAHTRLKAALTDTTFIKKTFTNLYSNQDCKSIRSKKGINLQSHVGEERLVCPSRINGSRTKPPVRQMYLIVRTKIKQR